MGFDPAIGTGQALFLVRVTLGTTLVYYDLPKVRDLESNAADFVDMVTRSPPTNVAPRESSRVGGVYPSSYSLHPGQRVRLHPAPSIRRVRPLARSMAGSP